MRVVTVAAITIASLGTSGCTSVTSRAEISSAPVGAQVPSAALAALFEASDEANLQRNPPSG